MKVTHLLVDRKTVETGEAYEVVDGNSYDYTIGWKINGVTCGGVDGDGNLRIGSSYKVTLGGGIQEQVTLVTSGGLTTTADTRNVIVDKSVGAVTPITLHAGVEGQVITIKDGKGDAATNNIVVTPNGAETIEKSAGLTVNTNYACVKLIFKGTNWYKLT